MNRTIHRRPEVSADIIGLAEYIARDSFEVALRFFDATEATIRGLVEMPNKGSLRTFADPRLANVRSHPIDGFPNHWIFYESTAQAVLIIAVLHGARDLPSALHDRSDAPGQP